MYRFAEQRSSRHIVITWVLLFSLLSAGGIAGCGKDGPITKIGQWIVAFATDVGQYIAKKASTFADAVAAAWEVFFPQKDGPVIVDKDNKLTGVYDGVLSCRIEWKSEGPTKRLNEMTVRLDHPRMVRSAENRHDWKLAPEAQQRLNEVRDTLLNGASASASEYEGRHSAA